jgi:hypothetical protein
VADLDGVWNVERVSGFLPPMVGVRKHINGSRGKTCLGPLPGVPFTVEGLLLRYRPPFSGFVDYIEPEGASFRGRLTYRGRELGRFRMVPLET